MNKDNPNCKSVQKRLAIQEKPLNGDEILEGFKETGFSPEEHRLRCFIEGVRFAERIVSDKVKVIT
jgi:hypothetical protein